MKSKITILAALVALFCVATSSFAAVTIKPVTVQEMARYGATHCLEVGHADLTLTDTNTAVVFTNAVAAPFSMAFVGYVLDQSFDSTSDTNAFDMTVSFGPSTATTKWISAVQVAEDATPTVKSSFGTDYSGTATVTLAATTNLVVITGVGTSSTYFVSGVAGTSAVTLASPWLSEQNSDVSLLLSLSAPGAGRAPADFTSGKLRIFLKILGPGWDRK